MFNAGQVNAQTLDSYLLKSLDGGFAEYGVNARGVVVRACGAGRKKRCLVNVVTTSATKSAAGTTYIHG